MPRWVVDLLEPAAADPELVGGKAAALHHLCQAGLRVPEAIVVTSQAFDAHFPDAAPAQTPARPAVQPALREALGAAVAERFAPDVMLAVRSSAASEDGARASFAGQHETHYYVAANALAEAVVDCWLSLWSGHAQAYRSRRAGDDSPFTMAVIVQRMVAADRAGVCFTTDPTGTQPGRVWIEAVWGLGAVLVDGRVSPDRLCVDRSGQVLERQVGRKRLRVAAALPRQQESRLEPVPLFQQTQPVLTNQQAAEVAARSLECEALFETPQDVEWAYQQDTLYLLQSRPVTTLDAPPPHAAGNNGAQDTRDAWVLFKPLAENFTEPLTPMTVDLFRRVLPPVGRFINGRYYLSLELAKRLMPFRWSNSELVDVMLLRGEVPELPWDRRRLPLAAAALAGAYLVDGISWHRSAALDRDSLEQYAVLCQQLRLDRARPAPAAFQQLVLGRHPFEPLGRLAFYVNVSAGRYFLLLGLLNKLVSRYAPDLDRHLLGQLCCGDGTTLSRQLVESVRALAEQAKQDAELVRQLTSDPGQELTAVLAGLPDAHPFAAALEGFMDTFGHRCMREMELAVPRWREDPLPVLLMVRGYLRSAAPSPTDPHALFLLAREKLRNALPRPWQRRLADYLVRRIRHYTSLREDTRHFHAMAMEVVRAKLLDMEQTLIADRRLRLAGDLFYLTWDEALALQREQLGWIDVADRIRQRRRRERALARAGTPELVSGRESGHAAAGAPWRANGVTASLVLTGQCASPGTAEGRVRIIRDPATANSLGAGEVLVAPYTDPAWTPLFPLAAAVVVEVGSFLSHAGTVAREYGVPCLVDVVHCTRRLREGQRVRVLASEGRLEVLEP